MLGKALKALNVPRSQYIVATKCGRYEDGFDFSAERVTRSIDESLERLQLDYVDILQCHDIEFGSLDQVRSAVLQLYHNQIWSRELIHCSCSIIKFVTVSRSVNCLVFCSDC